MRRDARGLPGLARARRATDSTPRPADDSNVIKGSALCCRWIPTVAPTPRTERGPAVQRPVWLQAPTSRSSKMRFIAIPFSILAIVAANGQAAPTTADASLSGIPLTVAKRLHQLPTPSQARTDVMLTGVSMRTATLPASTGRMRVSIFRRVPHPKGTACGARSTPIKWVFPAVSAPSPKPEPCCCFPARRRRPASACCRKPTFSSPGRHAPAISNKPSSSAPMGRVGCICLSSKRPDSRIQKNSNV